MMRSGWWLVVLLAACSKAEPPAKPDPGVTPKPPEVKVELAGVTLAEDCAEGARTKPLAPPPLLQPAAGSGQMPSGKVAGDVPSAGACAQGMNCNMPQRACEQTAMQLLVGVPPGAAPTTLAIKTVELLDDKGTVVGTLTARAPSKWDGSGAYVAWDQAVTTGSLAVSYKLTAPDWNTLTNGRWNAPSKKFALRVTVTISNKDRTIEKQSLVPATPEPSVVT